MAQGATAAEGMEFGTGGTSAKPEPGGGFNGCGGSSLPTGGGVHRPGAGANGGGGVAGAVPIRQGACMSFDIRAYVAFDAKGRGYCPSCERKKGRRPSQKSLAVLGSGAYKCHAGCTPEEIRNAVGQMNYPSIQHRSMR